MHAKSIKTCMHVYARKKNCALAGKLHGTEHQTLRWVAKCTGPATLRQPARQVGRGVPIQQRAGDACKSGRNGQSVFVRKVRTVRHSVWLSETV